jgi:hypothetical protein
MYEFQHLVHLLLIKTVRRISVLLWSKPNVVQSTTLLNGNSHTERKVDSAHWRFGVSSCAGRRAGSCGTRGVRMVGPAVDRQISRVHICYRTSSTPSLTRYGVKELQHYVSHGVTVTCKRYTMEFPFCYGIPSDVFSASRMFLHVYIYTLKNTKKKPTPTVVANATVRKQGSLQWF